MAKGQRLKSEQIVTLLRQIDVLNTNGKTLAQAFKEVIECYAQIFNRPRRLLPLTLQKTLNDGAPPLSCKRLGSIDLPTCYRNT